jgi:hypothetical protein
MLAAGAMLATSNFVPKESQPPAPARFATGLSGAIAQIETSSGETDEALSPGIVAAWRPLSPLWLWVFGRYSFSSEAHAYRDLTFKSHFHRVSLAAEGRLPIGRGADAALWAGPELVWQRSSLADAVMAAPDRGRLDAGLSTGVAAMIRWFPVELRLDVAFGLRDGRVDRAVIASVLFLMR